MTSVGLPATALATGQPRQGQTTELAQHANVRERQAQLEQRPCPAAVPVGTTCGFLLVPERRDVPDSKIIKVGYAVHKSTAADRKPDPVVYESGGPGSASLQQAKLLVQSVPDHDVVIVEQRGDRYSSPQLKCDEIVTGLVQTLRTPGQTAQETPAIIQQAVACRDRLRSQGIDLTGYRTAEIASDLVDLRRALGYTQWNLFGVGYSTRVMLQAASHDPRGTRSVVLDSFLPARSSSYGDAWPKLAAAIAKMGLTGRFDAMVARLNASPATFETRDPLTDGRVAETLNGNDVATILAESLDDFRAIPIIPSLVDGVADGKTGLLQPLVDQAGDALTSREWGLYYAVRCQDEPATTTAPNRPELFTDTVDRAVCQAWDLPPVPKGTTPATPGTTPATPGTTPSGSGGAKSGTAGAGRERTGSGTTGSARGTGSTKTGTGSTTKTPTTGTGTGGNSTGTKTHGTTGTTGGVTTTQTGTRRPATGATPGATPGGTRGTGSGANGGAGTASLGTGKTGVNGTTKTGTRTGTKTGSTVPTRAAQAPLPPMLVVGGQFDATTPPEAARQSTSRAPSARFVEFAGVGHGVFQSSDCGRRTISTFLDDPHAAAPCDPAKVPEPMVRPGTLFLTSSVYKIMQEPVMVAPLVLFALMSVVQLLGGLVGMVRRRGGWITAVAGVSGVVFIGLAALSLGNSTEAMLTIGIPKLLPWLAVLTVVATVASTVAAFRDHARSIAIVPSMVGLAFIAYTYGWLIG
ncbi:alpha/beta fold hydrolase [Planotetraspora thailandica]|uniref:alpha/beta fold hydrolase n=1 Tax=Planotetraspora thailandica TaxID=487172 RepID=UPI00194F97EB|nr:alpha/beta fold hydrolase [Planotetraspora thailandica]